MARLPRFFLPGFPLHVIQRGNNRMPIFLRSRDFLVYLQCIALGALRHEVAVHAYVLMKNHVHLLATPSCSASLPRMMQWIGSVYVPYFNATHERTGTLWEGRYKAAIVDDETYLLTCMRYIELNPVRAGIVARPGDYRWSSYRANAEGATDAIVKPHPTYAQLGPGPSDSRTAYRGLFHDAITSEQLDRIRDATQHAWALGNATFRHNVSALSRRAERLPKHPGRTQAAAEAAPAAEESLTLTSG